MFKEEINFENEEIKDAMKKLKKEIHKIDNRKIIKRRKAIIKNAIITAIIAVITIVAINK